MSDEKEDSTFPPKVEYNFNFLLNNINEIVSVSESDNYDPMELDSILETLIENAEDLKEANQEFI